MLHLVAYDIGSDGRREDVSDLLTTVGARVQLSLFECDVTVEHMSRLVVALMTLIEEDDDQVRVYVLDATAERGVRVLGRRVLEERRDFYIV